MPHPTDDHLPQSLWALHARVVRAFNGALDAVVRADPSRVADVRTEHRLIERALRDLEHAALVRMVDDATGDATGLTLYLKVGVQLAQIGDLSRAMAVASSTSRTAVDIDAASLMNALGTRLEERLAAALAVFVDMDAERARALEAPDPATDVLVARVMELGEREAKSPPLGAKCASHLRLIDVLIRSIAGLTRTAGAPAALFPDR